MLAVVDVPGVVVLVLIVEELLVMVVPVVVLELVLSRTPSGPAPLANAAATVPAANNINPARTAPRRRIDLPLYWVGQPEGPNAGIAETDANNPPQTNLLHLGAGAGAASSRNVLHVQLHGST